MDGEPRTQPRGHGPRGPRRHVPRPRTMAGFLDHGNAGEESMSEKPSDLTLLIQNLENGPGILRNLVSRIPKSLLKRHRIEGKWCIHAHACHIVDVQPMLIDRIVQFTRMEHPAFIPYIPANEDG